MNSLILKGGLIGLVVLTLLYPILLVFGLNKITSLILYYSIPLTGAITAFLIAREYGILGKRKEKGMGPEEPTQQIVENRKIEHEGVEKKTEYNELLGEWVRVHTNDGQLIKGRVKSTEDSMLALDYAVRMDIEDSEVFDRMFIDFKNIEKIETQNNVSS